jgi:hypothetical protein
MYQKTWHYYRYDFYLKGKLLWTLSRHDPMPNHFLGDEFWIEGEGDLYAKEVFLRGQDGDEMVIEITLLY